jgi:hypothetical protein
MRPGNLQAAAGRIQEALDELNLAWHETREVWNDQQAALFEEKVLQKIREELVAALPGVSQMSQTLGAAGRECSE